MNSWRAVRGYLRRHELIADAAFAVALCGSGVVVWAIGPRASWPPSWPLALLWSAISLSTLVIRRRRTRFAVVGLTAHTVAALLVFRDLRVDPVAIVVVTYTAAARLTLSRAIVAAALLWAPPLALGVSVLDTRRAPLHVQPVNFIVFGLMTVLLSVTVGRTVHHRRAYITALEGRALDAERNQRALAEQAVNDERRRIARELHDMVAHHVSVMGVLATGTRRTLHRDPVAADEALVMIEETGRTALREMRRLLDVMRTDSEPAPGELAPQPGLAFLPTLVEQVREAGLPVTLTMDGGADTLDPGIALTIYRIVQEALTNALKHAGSATADVRLDIGAYWLTLEVTDTGRGPRPGGVIIGHGLLGMRERVTLYGGTLRTGPRPGGGFGVSARIPVDAPGGTSTP